MIIISENGDELEGGEDEGEWDSGEINGELRGEANESGENEGEWDPPGKGSIGNDESEEWNPPNEDGYGGESETDSFEIPDGEDISFIPEVDYDGDGGGNDSSESIQEGTNEGNSDLSNSFEVPEDSDVELYSGETDDAEEQETSTNEDSGGEATRNSFEVPADADIELDLDVDYEGGSEGVTRGGSEWERGQHETSSSGSETVTELVEVEAEPESSNEGSPEQEGESSLDSETDVESGSEIDSEPESNSDIESESEIDSHSELEGEAKTDVDIETDTETIETSDKDENGDEILEKRNDSNLEEVSEETSEEEQGDHNQELQEKEVSKEIEAKEKSTYEHIYESQEDKGVSEIHSKKDNLEREFQEENAESERDSSQDDLEDGDEVLEEKKDKGEKQKSQELIEKIKNMLGEWEEVYEEGISEEWECTLRDWIEKINEGEISEKEKQDLIALLEKYSFLRKLKQRELELKSKYFQGKATKQEIKVLMEIKILFETVSEIEEQIFTNFKSFMNYFKKTQGTKEILDEKESFIRHLSTKLTYLKLIFFPHTVSPKVLSKVNWAVKLRNNLKNISELNEKSRKKIQKILAKDEISEEDQETIINILSYLSTNTLIGIFGQIFYYLTKHYIRWGWDFERNIRAQIIKQYFSITALRQQTNEIKDPKLPKKILEREIERVKKVLVEGESFENVYGFEPKDREKYSLPMLFFEVTANDHEGKRAVYNRKITKNYAKFLEDLKKGKRFELNGNKMNLGEFADYYKKNKNITSTAPNKREHGLNKDQTSKLYEEFHDLLVKYRDVLAEYIIKYLSDDPHFRDLAEEIEDNDDKMPTKSNGNLIDRIVAVLIGTTMGIIKRWRLKRRGTSRSTLRDIYMLLYKYYSKPNRPANLDPDLESDLQEFYAFIIGILRDIGQGIIPITRSAVYIRDFQYLIENFEERIIHALLGYPNTQQGDSELEKTLNKRLLNHPIHDYIEWSSERSDYVFKKIDANFLEAFTNFSISQNAVYTWFYGIKEISSSSYDSINEGIRSLFGETLNISADKKGFADFKKCFQFLGYIPSLEAQKIVQEAFREYFIANKKIFLVLIAPLVPNPEIQKRLGYQRQIDIRDYLIKTIRKLIRYKDLDFFYNLLGIGTDSLYLGKTNEWGYFVEDIEGLIDLIKDYRNAGEKKINALAELLYQLVFTKSLSFNDIRESAEKMGRTVLTSLSEWIKSLLNSDDKSPYYTNILTECKKCGYIQWVTASHLRKYKSFSCISCKGYGVRRRNERVTGVMIESLLLQIKEYIEFCRAAGIDPEIEVLEVEKEGFVFKQELNPDKGIFNITDEDKSTRMNVDLMRFDYSITLRIKGKVYIFVFESDGGQHMKNGKGFFYSLGIKQISISPLLRNLIKSAPSRSVLRRLMKSPDLISERILQEKYYEWEESNKRDDLKNKKFIKHSGEGTEQNPFKILVRIPTWSPSEGGLEDNQRLNHILERLKAFSGIDLTQFGVRTDHLQNFPWDAYIANVESTYGLWEPD